MNNDLISRSALVKRHERMCFGICDECQYALFDDEEPIVQCDLIRRAPIVDAEPVRHGWWISIEEQHWNCEVTILVAYKCSECGKEIAPYKENYCPNCGARMDGDERAAD